MKKDNRGIALISVMILITMLALLAGSLLHLAYLGYSRKATEKKNNENFYCAEAVIDNVKTVLQNAVVSVLDKAEISEEEFAKYAYCKIIDASYANINSIDPNANSDAVNNVREFLFKTVTTYLDKSAGKTVVKRDANSYSGDTSTIIGQALTGVGEFFCVNPTTGDVKIATAENQIGYEVYPGNGGSFSVEGIVLEKTSVRIKGVSVYYVNDQGYTASIKTDIVINAPKYIKFGDAPLGSYTMMAGSGACVVPGTGAAGNGCHESAYIHQEGNAYYGSMDGSLSRNSIMIGTEDGTNVNGVAGNAFLSFDGTNMIFNGDVKVAFSNTLIFTGGDGSKQAQVNVRGFIVLEDGATLLLAPNVNLTCLGIVTSVKYSSGSAVGEVKSYKFVNEKKVEAYNSTTQIEANKLYTAEFEPYTGNNYSYETVSPIYPLSINAVSSSTYYTKYKNNEIDVCELFHKTEKGPGKGGAQDDRYTAINKRQNVYPGVYILNTEQVTENGVTKWKQKDDTTCYNIVQCKIEKGADDTYGWNWKFLNDSDYGTVSTIHCDPTDINLKQVARVEYKVSNSEKYSLDAEVAKLVNVPLYVQAPGGSYGSLSKRAFGYSIEDETTYDEITWDTARTKYASDSYISSMNYESAKVMGAGVKKFTPFYDRSFYDPGLVTPETPSYSDYNIKTSLGTFAANANTLNFNAATDAYPRDSISDTPGMNGLYFVLSKNNIYFHTSRDYVSGIFLSFGYVNYGHNNHACRMISLVDLAKKVSAGPADITNKENDVHEMLAYIGSGIMQRNDSYDGSLNKYIMADNLFKGGIKAFWLMGASDGQQKLDNNGKDLIELDDWNKN